MNKSILFLTNTYPDFDTSYRGIFVKKMATLLKEQGYEITVVTPKVYRQSRYKERQDGMEVYRFPFLSGNKLLIEYGKIPYGRMILYYLMGFFFALYAGFKNNCDLIHVHWAIPTGLIGVFLRLLIRRPLLVTVHGSDFRLATEGSALLRRLFLWVCTRANHLTCVSGVLRGGMERLGVPQQKISTFPMGVDGKFLDVGRQRNDVPTERPLTVISNRNLLPLYNLSLLIHSIPGVLEKEPGTLFLIAGEGTQRSDLEKQVKELKVEKSVRFLGRVAHESMPELLLNSDIYVSTSLSDGTSVSLLEAMAAGAFPIVTAIPSTLEWIKDGENGFLVPATEERVLAERIVRVIRDRTLLKKGRQANMKIVQERALWPVTIGRVREIYSKILGSAMQNSVA